MKKISTMVKKEITFNLDFDGTCVSHDFPHIGKDIGAQRVLKRLTDAGHKLILFTMRADRLEKNPTKDPTIKDVTGTFLSDAINWFKENDIPLYGIQSNPTQHNWTTSPKSYAEFMIDDSAIGCPLIFNPQFSPKPYVNWDKIERILIMRKILKYERKT